jgi:hypothetical protein
MKKLFFLTLMIAVFSCKEKKTEHETNNKYAPILNYIKEIEPYKTSGLYVVDTLFYISSTTFSEDLLKDKGSERGIQILDSLERVDKKISFKNKLESLLVNINSDDKSKYNLYFSEQRDNIIDFEILDNKGDINNTHDYLTMFGVGYIYSVSLDDGKVKILKKVEVTYN